MNSQFHTPSLGDGFDLSGVEEASTNITDLGPVTQAGIGGGGSFQQLQLDQFESKRMQSMEHNMSVAGISDLNCTGGGLSNSGTSGIFNITAHLQSNNHNHNNNNSNNNFNSNGTNSHHHIHTPPTTMAARKQLSPSAIDSNGPAKPLSPYALFFRDTVSVIKQQNPNCNFEDLKLIASTMWEALDPVQKDVYNKKTEAARKDYVKQLQIQQQQQPQPLNLQQPRSDNQSLVMTNNETTSISTTNNLNQLQYPQGQQSNVLLTTPTENQVVSTPAALTTVAAAANASQVENTQNSQHAGDAQHAQPETNSQLMPTPRESITMEVCIRDGCNKRAIMNPDWEDEYCSNECVVIHCRNVFNDWVQQNKEAASVQQ